MLSELQIRINILTSTETHDSFPYECEEAISLPLTTSCPAIIRDTWIRPEAPSSVFLLIRFSEAHAHLFFFSALIVVFKGFTHF